MIDLPKWRQDDHLAFPLLSIEQSLIGGDEVDWTWGPMCFAAAPSGSV